MAGMADNEERKATLKDFLNNHVKTSVTVLMILGTLLCIILIVMVHEWEFEKDRLVEESECLDVAIIGAGVSGTYAAWRLRHSHLKTHLFEVSDRVGGRLYTRRLQQFPSLKAELGAVHYVPQWQPLTSNTIHSLGLTPEVSHPPGQDNPTHFLRGQLLKDHERHDWDSHYHVNDDEKGKPPEQLWKEYLSSILSDDSNVFDEPLKAKTKDGVPLYKSGLWNILREVSSQEGFNLLYDTAPWRALMTNHNAALLVQARAFLDNDTHYETLEEGMDAMPKKLLQEFINASSEHVAHFNHRLACLRRKKQDIYTLSFIKTTTRNDVTRDNAYSASEKRDFCAKRVILALPQKALQDLNFKDFQRMTRFRHDLSTVEPVPSFVAYFSYNYTWWLADRPQSASIITDLPIRHIHHIGSDALSDITHTRKQLFMVSNVQGADVDYFEGITSSAQLPAGSTCSLSPHLIKDINHQVADAYGRSRESFHPPQSLLLQQWSNSPSGAGWYMWRRHVDWDTIASRMLHPFQKESVYVVGSTYSPGHSQLWIEGALQTVDKVMREHFILDVEHNGTSTPPYPSYHHPN